MALLEVSVDPHLVTQGLTQAFWFTKIRVKGEK